MTPQDALSLLGYSLRRYFVDGFLLDAGKRGLFSGSVLDIGGMRDSRRGVFQPDNFASFLVTLNIAIAKRPHVLGDALTLPIAGSCFDAALCSEVLEHVREPEVVLVNAFRVLKPGGVIVATAPFLHPIHADPDDFGRYTASFWRQSLTKCGFDSIEITPQGDYAAFLLDMLRAFLAQRPPARSRLGRRAFGVLAAVFLRLRRVWLAKRRTGESPLGLNGFDCGYGIVARKPL